MASAVAEEYLETIYNLEMEGEPVIGARLAEKFGVSRVTAGETIKRLVTEGYVVQDAEKHVTLTPEGQALTEHVLRRHRLAERLLFDVLGMDWVSAHEQAHSLEHWISTEVEQRISALLGHPTTCPHGNPIPGNASSAPQYLREQQAFRLAEAAPQQAVQVVLISEVVEDESEVLRHLSDKGIYPGARLTVTGRDEESLAILQHEREMRSTLARPLAGKIWVREPREVAA